MAHLRKWVLPTGLVIHRHDEVVNGNSYFWYCAFCGEIYARATAFKNEDEGAEPLPFTAINGCCLSCSGDRFNISGSLETVRFLGWKVPIEVAHYQLDREIVFLDHPDHPHNRSE